MPSSRTHPANEQISLIRTPDLMPAQLTSDRSGKAAPRALSGPLRCWPHESPGRPGCIFMHRHSWLERPQLPRFALWSANWLTLATTTNTAPNRCQQALTGQPSYGRDGLRRGPEWAHKGLRTEVPGQPLLQVLRVAPADTIGRGRTSPPGMASLPSGTQPTPPKAARIASCDVTGAVTRNGSLTNNQPACRRSLSTGGTAARGPRAGHAASSHAAHAGSSSSRWLEQHDRDGPPPARCWYTW